MNHAETWQAEMASEYGDRDWMNWANAVEARLGFDLDGDENTDGYSLDGAWDAFVDEKTVEEYVSSVLSQRASLATN